MSWSPQYISSDQTFDSTNQEEDFSDMGINDLDVENAADIICQVFIISLVHEPNSRMGVKI